MHSKTIIIFDGELFRSISTLAWKNQYHPDAKHPLHLRWVLFKSSTNSINIKMGDKSRFCYGIVILGLHFCSTLICLHVFSSLRRFDIIDVPNIVVDVQIYTTFFYYSLLLSFRRLQILRQTSIVPFSFCFICELVKWIRADFMTHWFCDIKKNHDNKSKKWSIFKIYCCWMKDIVSAAHTTHTYKEYRWNFLISCMCLSVRGLSKQHEQHWTQIPLSVNEWKNERMKHFFSWYKEKILRNKWFLLLLNLFMPWVKDALCDFVDMLIADAVILWKCFELLDLLYN